jgi:hypothetical protein
VVEEKMRFCVSGVVKCGHGFNPFGKVINCHNNLLVSITGWRMEIHEVYAPFIEGANCDRWMEKRWWRSFFVFIKLVLVASLKSVDATMKQSGLEVPCSNDFLGGGHT